MWSERKENSMDQTNLIVANQYPDWKKLCKLGGTAALVQLTCCLITMLVIFTMGEEPATAEEYFHLLNTNRSMTLLRMDFPSVFTVSLYTLTLFGLVTALPRRSGGILRLALGLGFTGIVLWLSKHSALSMISLGDQYAAAATDLQRSQLLAAGQAVIASDMWHSTAAFLSGIFLQSALTFISVLMLQGGAFSKATAWVGVLTHGLDLLHVLVMPFAPAIGAWLLIVFGTLYPVWFFMVGRRLLQLGKVGKER
jgi:hypothetical protein